MKTKTLQEVFDKSSKHLMRQRSPALDPDGSCMNLTPEGKMCALGCLLPKSLFENGTLNAQLQEAPFFSELRKQGIDENEPRMHKMLNRLRKIHDECEPEQWKRKLTLLARDYKLQVNF